MSKIALFILCKESQGVEEMSQLYIQYVFPYYELPDHIISDQDPHIISQWFIDICFKLEITKNISIAYYP
jgi:hypothetical protein